jgi:pimeloyl-ACP methyl ester carboxylesterase
MLFKVLGNINNKRILLIHGMSMEGGNFYCLEALLPSFCLIIPTLDGHYAKGKTTFLSLNDQVDKIICYLNDNKIDELFCVAGISLGALIAFEIFKRDNIQVQKYIFDGGPFFKQNFFQKNIMEMIYKFIFFVVKITNGDFMFPKALLKIKTSVVNYSKFVTKTDIKNIAHTIFNLEIPESINKNKDIIFLYGSKEMALKSMKRFKGVDGYRLLIIKNWGHCQFFVNSPEEYAKLFNS